MKLLLSLFSLATALSASPVLDPDAVYSWNIPVWACLSFPDRVPFPECWRVDQSKPYRERVEYCVTIRYL